MTTRYIRVGWVGENVRDDMYTLFSHRIYLHKGKLFNDAIRALTTKDIITHYGVDDVKESCIRIIQYYKLKAYNKISYNTDSAVELWHAATAFASLLWDTHGVIFYTLEDIKFYVVNHDTMMTQESASKFISECNKKLDEKIMARDSVMLEILRDVAIDLYNRRRYDEIPKDLEVAYMLLSLPKVYNIKNKELITHDPSIAYPVPRLSFHDGVRYPRIKMSKLQIKKAMLFGSMSKCIEETIEAYLENNPDNFIKEVTDIYITRYHMELRRELINRKLISIGKEDSLIHTSGIYVRNRIPFSDIYAVKSHYFDWVQNVGLSYNFGSEVEHIGTYQDLKGWYFRMEKSKDEDDFSKDTFNILMYFKDKTDKEM